MSEIPPNIWMPMSLFPPESCESYDVKLDDDRTQRAFWSGKAWWLQGKPVTPKAWRLLPAVEHAA